MTVRAVTAASSSSSAAMGKCFGDVARYYHLALGAPEGNESPQRIDEAYPQWGDGYIWEPALQVSHADGNTSIALLYDSATRTNEAPNREQLRIKLLDPVYPLEV